jgi:D-serine deaminase-like pyridoxal phosphate-dependent protein
MKRRSLILGSLAGATALGWALKPREIGSNHSPYFAQASAALDSAGLAKPSLVIDRELLLKNIRTLTSHIGDRFDYRIVAKSLPSLPLLRTVMEASGSHRLMLFHQPFLNEVATHLPTADVLMGKPMPVAAVANFYRNLGDTVFDPARQLRWLIDTPQRAQQYAEFAGANAHTMKVCIELDVGLHRGGVRSDEQLLAILNILDTSPAVHFAGFMGYEPHVVKVPGDPVKHRDKAMAAYTHYVELARSTLGDNWPQDVLLNAGGSPTYQLYNEGRFPFNELAAGSCLVKPTDFDLPSLADHQPAAYIATPVLKSLDTLEIPGIDLGAVQAWWNPNRAKTFFTYGGYWKAIPESPAGLSVNPLFGRSTNQEMLNGSARITLKPDDWVFLRPTQSEFVFLQFGDIAVMNRGTIDQLWPVFQESA